jgi:thiol-disulfide isomerase/thioredoxin
MAPRATNPPGAVVIDPRVLIVGGAVALLGVLVLAVFLWMVPSGAAREVRAACASMKPVAPNPALCKDGRECKFPMQAPDFTAYDYQGKPVHLSDFRGKTVLLNYWASWCGVCTTEKPHLNKMAEDLASDDFVVIALASDRTWSDVLIALVHSLAPHSGFDEMQATVTVFDDPGLAKVVRILRTHPGEKDTILPFLEARAGDAYEKRVEETLKAAEAAPVPISEALEAYKKALPNGVPFQVFLDHPSGDENIGQIAASWGIKAVPESALIDKQGNIRAYFDNQRDWKLPVVETCLRSLIDED